MHARPSRGGPAVAAALLLVVAVPAAATDTVDLQIGGPAKVKGTIRDATERERFLLQLPAGTTVRAKAKPKGKVAPVPSLDFVDGMGIPVATGTNRGRTASLSVPALPGTGLYRVRLTGDGSTDGDYQLQIAPKYRTTFTGSGDTAAAAFVGFSFAAPANSTARIEVKPAKGSAFVPSLSSVDGPGTFVAPLAGGGRAGPVTLGPGGDYDVQMTNAGGDGAFTWKVTVSAPKVRTANIDITARALSGEFTYGQAVLGREVGSEGGFLDPSAEGVPLDGTLLDVPAGALATPTVLTVAESTPFFVASGINPTGPAIRFGPSGTEFSIPATVTIPFDPAAYADPAAEMTIYILNEETGTVEPAPKPYDFSGAPGTVTFPTTHFSTFLSTNQRPRTITGDWVWVRSRGAAYDRTSGGAGIVVGDVTFDAAGGWNAYGYGPGTVWGFDGDTGAPVIYDSGESLPAYGSWNVASDVQVDLFDSVQNLISFRREESPDAMVEIVPAPAQTPQVLFSALLRRPRGGATPATTVGKWHFVRVSQRGRAQYDPASQTTTNSLEGTSIQGTVTFSPDATAQIAIEGTPLDAEAPFPTGPWNVKTNVGAPPAAWQANGDVYLYIGVKKLPTEGPGRGAKRADEIPPYVAPVRLRPVLGGDVLVGIDGEYQETGEEDAALMFLVRASSGASKASLLGQFDHFDFETGLRDAPLPVAGFVFSARSEGVTYDGAGRATGGGRYGPSISHDAQGTATMVYDSPDGGGDLPPPPFSYRVDPDGGYSDGRGVRGALTRSGDVLVALQSSRSARFWRLVLGVRRRASKT